MPWGRPGNTSFLFSSTSTPFDLRPGSETCARSTNEAQSRAGTALRRWDHKFPSSPHVSHIPYHIIPSSHHPIITSSHPKRLDPIRHKRIGVEALTRRHLKPL